MTDLEKSIAMIERFLQEGEYNDEGDYVFVSDTIEAGLLAEPGSMVPGIVLDAAKLLAELKRDE